MTLGIDYHNVITQFPTEFLLLANAVKAEGGQVYIISAITEKGLVEHGGMEAYKAKIAHTNVPHDEICVVVGPSEMFPRLKFVECRKYGVDIFIDDREDIVKFLHAKGIVALKVPKPL